MSNKVVQASEMYCRGAASIRYIIYTGVLMLFKFHVQVPLVTFFIILADVFDPGTHPMSFDQHWVTEYGR